MDKVIRFQMLVPLSFGVMFSFSDSKLLSTQKSTVHQKKPLVH